MPPYTSILEISLSLTENMSKGQSYLTVLSQPISKDDLRQFLVSVLPRGGNWGHLNAGSPPPIYTRGVGGGSG